MICVDTSAAESHAHAERGDGVFAGPPLASTGRHGLMALARDADLLSSAQLRRAITSSGSRRSLGASASA